MAERPFNVTSILSNFKSLMEQVYEKACTHKINKKTIKYLLQSRFKPKVVKTTYTEKKKKADWALNTRQNVFFFLKSKCNKSELDKACMSYHRFSFIKTNLRYFK